MVAPTHVLHQTEQEWTTGITTFKCMVIKLFRFYIIHMSYIILTTFKNPIYIYKDVSLDLNTPFKTVL